MAISKYIIKSMERSSWIRKMFEEGARLKKEFGAENIFDFSLGNPNVPPPDNFFSALQKVASEKKTGIHGYMPNAGFPEVKNSIAQKVSKDHNVKITGDSIVMTCGAAGGLNVILKTILDNQDEVIVLKPYFVEYGFYIENHNGKMVLVNTNDDFSVNIDNIKKAITKKTKAILINSPNNPSGKIYSQTEISAISSLLNDYANQGQSIFLISDEPYREIVYEGIEVPSILKNYSNSIITTSFSKTLSIPGERIGYIAVNPQITEFNLLMGGLTLSNRILGFVNAPALMQRVVAMLNNSSVNIAEYKKKRDLLSKGLSDAGYKFIPPEGAFYLFCKSPIENDVKFVKHLQKFNILAVPGTGFGTQGFFRLSYCVADETIINSIEKFKQAMETINE